MTTSKLSNAIGAANEQNRLGLILFAIPGFPDLEGYRAIINMLEQRACVSIIEHTLPVDHGYETANATIIQAHHTAMRELNEEVSADLLQTTVPNFLVLYQHTIEAQGLSAFLDVYGSVIDGLVPEWDDLAFIEHNRAALNEFSVECLAVVDTIMSTAEIEAALRFSAEDGLIYLSCSPMTGGELATLESLQTCIRFVKTLRPQATIAAGMGIKSADDIRRLAQLDDLNAVVVGTSFLQNMTTVEQASRFIDQLEPALTLS